MADVLPAEWLGGQTDAVVILFLHALGCAEMREESTAAIRFREGAANQNHPPGPTGVVDRSAKLRRDLPRTGEHCLPPAVRRRGMWQSAAVSVDLSALRR